MLILHCYHNTEIWQWSSFNVMAVYCGAPAVYLCAAPTVVFLITTLFLHTVPLSMSRDENKEKHPVNFPSLFLSGLSSPSLFYYSLLIFCGFFLSHCIWTDFVLVLCETFYSTYGTRLLNRVSFHFLELLPLHSVIAEDFQLYFSSFGQMLNKPKHSTISLRRRVLSPLLRMQM